ncbi:MarR family winged helix-turn-helix transcriptional regulator [Gandjariella thermophila]|uniref:Putative HTH-type transcriptional regulator YcgE n=1 Tax=Gandjariella thermophila TaxID=1931992 RepID=A0A4D4J8U2_9PSEU|nr:MarR family transcriptional regulator [Gandjariella thermophila]GDY30829.1 putative HTH-type transcriptional regulator YcgE [Gandjariella thermophila]
MSRTSKRRGELVDVLEGLLRDMAARGVLVHQAIADRFGLNSTDLKALDLARGEPNLTAGRLAEITGLSTSAVTALLDRLERAGFVERRRDPADRRRVFVVSTGRHEEELTRIFGLMSERMRDVLRRYDDERLAVAVDFLGAVNDAARDVMPEITGREPAE